MCAAPGTLSVRVCGVQLGPPAPRIANLRLLHTPGDPKSYPVLTGPSTWLSYMVSPTSTASKPRDFKDTTL